MSGKNQIAMMMKMKYRIIFFLAVSFFSGLLIAQDDQQNRELVQFTPDFKFKDGIYLNFEQVRLNDPIPKSKILTSTDYNDKDFFRNLFEAEKIYFYDVMGIRQEIEKSSVWGYSRNGVLYVQMQNNFSRVTFVGSICHFVADIISYDSRYYNSPYGYSYYDPYYYYNPYSYYGYYNPYSYYSPYSRNSMTRSDVKQFVFNFEDGKVMDFDMESTELLIMGDEELYEEFMKLPRKKKRDLMFVYIRKYNERNPLYIPVNQ